MRVEAVARARALVAGQAAAAAPFGKTYVTMPPHQPAAEEAASK